MRLIFHFFNLLDCKDFYSLFHYSFKTAHNAKNMLGSAANKKNKVQRIDIYQTIYYEKNQPKQKK